MGAPVKDAGPPRVEDYLFTFEGGMDSGTAPLLLPPNVMSYCTNGTVRGDFLTNRPPFKDRQLTWDSPATQATFETGYFQGGCYAAPDSTAANPGQLLIGMFGNHVLAFRPAGNVVSVSDITPAVPFPAPLQPQCWLWQAEQFVIINNGRDAPIFVNVNTLVSTRSNYAGQTGFATTIGAAFVVPAAGATITLTLAATANINPGDTLVIQYTGNFNVTSIVSPTQVAGSFPGPIIAGINGPNGASVNWNHQNFNLPPGRMGAYVDGRNWVSLLDGKQFVASDITGGPSGTAANNYRDAVLSITENTFLAGGGNFSIPGRGPIRAIIGLPTLDASLGQGPVLVLTATQAYSCQAPVDRTTWSTVTTPILTAAMLTNAALGQNSTFTANSDVFMRSLEGMRSLIVTRNDFQQWGNTIISYELNRILPKDNPSLLPWATGIAFDNRALISASPIAGPTGVYHKGLGVMNFDPKASLGSQQPAVWESVWLGIFPMQLIGGEFSLVDRCWSFSYNPTTKKNQLDEILSDGDDEIYDNVNQRIGITFESPTLFKDPDPRERMFKRLFNGEIYVSDLQGTVDFYVFYRPDFFPGWIPWQSWTECQQQPTGTPGTATFKPGYRSRMGLGEPSGNVFDDCSNRPMREAFNYQVKIEIVGHCIFNGARFEAIIIPRPMFAPISTTPICP